jgi:hypothetical protein
MLQVDSAPGGKALRLRVEMGGRICRRRNFFTMFDSISRLARFDKCYRNLSNRVPLPIGGKAPRLGVEM